MQDATPPHPTAESPRATSPDRTGTATLLLTAATTVILLQATRVFLSYMVFIIDQAERVQLGTTAGAVYLSIALGAMIPLLVGMRRSIAALTAGMLAARLLLQFWDRPDARMWLGAAVIVLTGWLLPLLIATSRPAAAYGVGVGLGLDIAFRVARSSIDLAFIPSIGADVATVALATTALFGALAIFRAEQRNPARGLAFSAIALGPALALHHLVTGNIGAVEVRADVGMPSAAWLLSAGVVAGLVLDRFPGRSRPPIGTTGPARMTMIVAVAAIGAAGLLVFWKDFAGMGTAGALIGTAATIALIVHALRGGIGNGGAAATAAWLTLGFIVHAIALFAYFTATGLPVLIVAMYATLSLVAILVAWRPQAPALHAVDSLRALGGLAAILLVATIVLTLQTSASRQDGPLEGEVTVMTYNIQSGFSRDNYWDLENIARIIEAADPDIVLLQEVGRGWPILASVDQAHWLSARLDMQLVWGPASQDDLWGNAILTRAPISSTEWIKYDTTENLRRGAVRADIETSSGTLTVIATHIDNPGSATGARQQQIAQLLEFWGTAEPAVIAGDLNTDPDSDVIASIVDAGFTDTVTAEGGSVITSEDGRRIDYILITRGLEVRSVDIPGAWASDHLPVVTTLRIAP